jgi:aquaporin Z
MAPRAAILARYGGRGLQPWETVLVLSVVSAQWLVAAVYFLGDVSAHFNPATTLAFVLRRESRDLDNLPAMQEVLMRF